MIELCSCAHIEVVLPPKATSWLYYSCCRQNMAAVCSVVVVGLLIATLAAAQEQGKWTLSLNQDHRIGAAGKLMFKDSKVTVRVSLMCDHGDLNGVEIEWVLLMSPCNLYFAESAQDINTIKVNPGFVDHLKDEAPYLHITEWINGEARYNCFDKDFTLLGLADQTIHTPEKMPQGIFVPGQSPDASGKRRAAVAPPGNETYTPYLARAWVDGGYLFIIKLKSEDRRATNFSAKVTIRTFYGDENYISAMDYPLLIFYGVMGHVYMVYGLVWLVLLACNWRDLLRVQFWIGGVILLGILKYVALFAWYNVVNNTGQTQHAGVLVCEFLLVLSGSVFRMLVMIFSVGFTIAKPRLGCTFYIVLILGGLNFALVFAAKCDIYLIGSYIAFLILAIAAIILELVIWIWVLVSLCRTVRILRRTNKKVKLRLYVIFTVALVIAAVATVANLIQLLVVVRPSFDCLKNWKLLWLSDAFWHIPTAAMLLVMMLLWRPSVNNQRYAFSPLLDAADKEEDEDDVVQNETADGINMTSLKASAVETSHSQDTAKKPIGFSGGIWPLSVNSV